MAPLAALSPRYDAPTNGIVGGYNGNDVNILRAMIAFSAITWYNCIELVFLIMIRFRHWRGLYFWSLMATSWSIIIYQIGSWGKMRNIVPGNGSVMTAFTNVGWICMITGNSLVLYSRLHLLCQNRIMLRTVFWGIIINSVVLYIPTSVLDFGANITHPDKEAFVDGYAIMERIQMTLFSAQEILISSVYLYQAWKYLKVTYVDDKRTRAIIYELLAVNVLIILMDIALLAVLFKNLFQIEITLKGLIYTLKLKLELGVLSRLVRLVSGTSSGLHMQHAATTTFENDLKRFSTLRDDRDDNNKAFGGLDFCTTPFAQSSSSSKPSPDLSDSSDEPSSPPALRNKSFAASSVPWLSTTLNAQPMSTITQERNRHSSSAVSPLTPPPVHKLSQHTLQRGESYTNSEFLTSAAVTEGANDDNIRQFQREIDAELGAFPGAVRTNTATSASAAEAGTAKAPIELRRTTTATSDVAIPSASAAPGAGQDSTASGTAKVSGTGKRKASKTSITQDADEESWARGLGVLGPEIDPELERKLSVSQDSLRGLYPGRITGAGFG